jgi:hypothetical protein
MLRSDNFQVMTLADSLQAKKPIALRPRTYGGGKFIGSLLVPKKMSDGYFPVVDVWGSPGEDSYLAPFKASPTMPKNYIGRVSHDGSEPMEAIYKGKRLLRVHTASGVEPVGFGFGYILYAAAALALGMRSGYDGIFSLRGGLNTPGGARSIDANELWKRLTTIRLGHGRPLAQEASLQVWVETLSTGYGEDGDEPGMEMQIRPGEVLLTQDVLDSGLVTRLTGRPWAKFRPMPAAAQEQLALDIKYKTKKPTPFEKYTVSHAS